MQRGFGFSGEFSHAHRDVVFTPNEIAVAMVRHFRPFGRILDPCKGDGAFFELLDEPYYCELQEGRDFFEWSEHVDWIIGNPPYSCYSDWLAHSMTVADNIVYLIPINKAFNSSSMLASTYKYGGIVEIVHVGPGSRLKFPIGFAIGAVHYQRDYVGKILYRHEFPLPNGGNESG